MAKFPSAAVVFVHPLFLEEPDSPADQKLYDQIIEIPRHGSYDTYKSNLLGVKRKVDSEGVLAFHLLRFSESPLQIRQSNKGTVWVPKVDDLLFEWDDCSRWVDGQPVSRQSFVARLKDGYERLKEFESLEYIGLIIAQAGVQRVAVAGELGLYASPNGGFGIGCVTSVVDTFSKHLKAVTLKDAVYPLTGAASLEITDAIKKLDGTTLADNARVERVCSRAKNLVYENQIGLEDFLAGKLT